MSKVNCPLSWLELLTWTQKSIAPLFYYNSVHSTTFTTVLTLCVCIKPLISRPQITPARTSLFLVFFQKKLHKPCFCPWKSCTFAFDWRTFSPLMVPGQIAQVDNTGILNILLLQKTRQTKPIFLALIPPPFLALPCHYFKKSRRLFVRDRKSVV